MVTEDIAFGKPVMEFCNHPEFLTNDAEVYGGNDSDQPGYLGTHWPTFVTVDLIDKKTVGVICLKLWDWEDSCNQAANKENNKEMQYAYRLLISEDRKLWTVLFDCADSKRADDKFHKGWELFFFKARPIRYIRIHCLRNRKNSGFHIVKLKAFQDDTVDFFQTLSTNFYYVNCNAREEKELGEGVPTSFRLINLAGKIQEIGDLSKNRLQVLLNEKTSNESEHEITFLKKVINSLDNQLKFRNNDIFGRLLKRAHEVEVVSNGIDEIRSLVAEPIRRKGESDCKEDRIDFLTDFLFGMFQFCVVAAMYFVENNKFGFKLCVLALLISIIVFLVQFYRKSRSVNYVCSEASSKKPTVLSICDSTGEVWEQGYAVKPVGISVLSLPTFLNINDNGISALSYNESEGFHAIQTPGWIEFDFGKKEYVRYLRFLLWDNAGSKKRQQSHRLYNYRVLFRESEKEPWKVIHDTIGQGSRGWQEFINASEKPWPIRFVRIYGISNSGTTGAGTLQLVRLGISQEVDDQDIQHVIRNRIVKYGDILETGEEELIDIMKIINWLKQRIELSRENNKKTDVNTKWNKSVADLVASCGRKIKKDESPNESILSLFSEVLKFVEKLVSEEYTIESSEDFARDIQSLVAETLKPVQDANITKKWFEKCMRVPKTILVIAATGPIIYDCFKKGSVIMTIVATLTILISAILILTIWKPDNFKIKSNGPI